MVTLSSLKLTFVSDGARASGASPASPPAPTPSGPVSEALQLIEGKAASAPAPPAKSGSRLPDSGQTYTVGKGETAYAIAHKLKVSYNALLKLNQIDDPKKLKTGQKLRLPPKTAG